MVITRSQELVTSFPDSCSLFARESPLTFKCIVLTQEEETHRNVTRRLWITSNREQEAHACARVCVCVCTHIFKVDPFVGRGYKGGSGVFVAVKVVAT